MNGDIAIRVEGLSKKYRIGLKEQRHETFVGAVTDWIRQPIRNFRNLRKLTRFDDGDEEDVIWALRDVSFEVKRGEVVGIIGRNGAGKSTLLKILARITEPTSGRAFVNGRVGSLLEVGTGMHPELTGRENIYLSGTILGMTKAEIDKKFEEIVEFAELGKFIDTPVKRYSSGMKVRLGFAIAAHLEPEILLVDEVLAVGDAAFQKKCLGKMGDVARAGRTVLFVSHNMAAIQSICDKAMVIQNGNLIYIDDSNKAINYYMNILDSVNHTINSNKLYNKDVEILKVTIKSNSFIKVFDKVEIEFVIRFKNKIKNVLIGIRLYNEYGVKVCSFHTREMGLLVNDIEGLTNIIIKIPRFYGAPGKYYVHFLITTTKKQDIINIENILNFEVHPKDFSGHGHIFTAAHGILLMPYSIEIWSKNHRKRKIIA